MLYPDKLKNTVFLSSAYLPPVEYYRQLVKYEKIYIEKYCNFVKQTYRNRCKIVTANGIQVLSIPIEKPDREKCLTKDIRISAHGNWQHIHWQAIVSAYNSSPFFEYYEDDFRHFYSEKQVFLFDLNIALNELICNLIDIQPTLLYTESYKQSFTPNETDLRESIHPKKPAVSEYFQPYYQVFSDKLGFQPNLSIVDLLFNMGPESIFYLV